MTDAVTLTIAILSFTTVQGLLPDIDDPFLSSVVDIALSAVTALATLLVISALFSRPRIEVEWIVGRQIPRSDRPELRKQTGIFFRYSIQADTAVANFVLKRLREHNVEAQMKFSPAENLKIIAQYLAPSIEGDSEIKTPFGRDLRKGNSCDGDFSLRLKQGRSADTAVDCTVTLHPGGSSVNKTVPKLLCRWIKTDPLIKGFILKGDS